MSSVVINFGGTKIRLVNLQEIINYIKRGVSGNKKNIQLVTLNPEMIVEANTNSLFKRILEEKRCWVVPDGIGVVFALRFLSVFGFKRITGIDLIYKLTKKFNDKSRFFLFGGYPGVAEKTAIVLRGLFPSIKIVGTKSGYSFSDDDIINEVNRSRSDILFVALGNPKQEIWISKNLERMPSIKLAVGVGGSFDYISGKIMRAPRILRSIGMEWLWRLLLQPWRAKRIFKAVVIFPYLIIKNFLKPVSD
jgi:N-acetylglucosaminyldiphosphoundecaprenol N-acetyl-beta-D-mannosaminyltransferase